MKMQKNLKKILKMGCLQMNSKNLWLLCGPAASGKTTWALNQIKENNGVVISRDTIRFNLLKENDDYFAHETEVFNKFAKEINEALKNNENVYVDATHLNKISRNKILNKLNLDDVNINCVNFMTELDECLKRNDNRTGRAFVPKSVIRRMSFQFQPAVQGELFKYNKIIEVR